jgi:peptidoglycan/LPS O-acetylase OafA/YrhL
MLIDKRLGKTPKRKAYLPLHQHATADFIANLVAPRTFFTEVEMAHIGYRAEIDGLRAIAVVSVLFYHAEFVNLPGGFMGVDIFFVISGFLITSFVIKDLSAGTFSFSNFWERRARRILPPLFVVVSGTLLAGWMILLHIDFRELGQEMASQSLFSSNLLFTKQGGYFDQASELKPLLHTWSLAVEEQFYLFFPLFLFLISKYLKPALSLMLWIGTIVSLILALICVELSQRYAFYLLPFRGWELLAGSLIAIGAVPNRTSAWLREAASFAGLALLVASLFFYDKSFLFPGYVALLPVIGTAAIIWSNTGYVTQVGKWLSWRPVTAIGLISYSLYLWHWPVLVLSRYVAVPYAEFNWWMRLGCIAVCVLLAIATWYFVEQPVRKKTILKSTRAIYLTSFAGLLLMGVSGLALVHTNGMPQRFDDRIASYADGVDDINPARERCDQPSVERIAADDVCQTNAQAGTATFALWGDSHADAIAPAFVDASARTGTNGYILTARGCPPILGTENNDVVYRYTCEKQNDAFFDLIVRHHIKRVYLAAYWSGVLRDGGKIVPAGDNWYVAYKASYDNWKMAGLARTIDKLRKYGVDVFVLVDVPTGKIDPPRMLAMQEFANRDERYVLPFAHYREGLESGIYAFRKMYGEAGVTFIDPGTQLCDGTICRTEAEGRSLYHDKTHLSAFGARYIGRMLDLGSGPAAKQPSTHPMLITAASTPEPTPRVAPAD